MGWDGGSVTHSIDRATRLGLYPFRKAQGCSRRLDDPLPPLVGPRDHPRLKPPFSAAAYLRTEEERQAYMDAPQEDGDPLIIEKAERDIKRSRTGCWALRGVRPIVRKRQLHQYTYPHAVASR